MIKAKEQIQREIENLKVEMRKLNKRYARANTHFEEANIRYDIQRCKTKIQELEDDLKYGQTTLKELLPQDEMIKRDIHLSLVKVSLASDYLYDCLFSLQGKLDDIGLIAQPFYEEIKNVCNMANKLASKLIFDQAPKLKDVLLDDEPMVDKLHEIIDNYINKTLLK